MFVTAVVVRHGTNPINFTAVLLEPLWARSTHVMTFGMVTLDWLNHWRSPSAIKLHRGSVNRKYQVAINTTAGGCGCIRTRGDKAATGSLLPESVRWPVIVEGLAFDGDLHFVLRDLEQAHPNDER